MLNLHFYNNNFNVKLLVFCRYFVIGYNFYFRFFHVFQLLKMTPHSGGGSKVKCENQNVRVQGSIDRLSISADGLLTMVSDGTVEGRKNRDN